MPTLRVFPHRDFPPELHWQAVSFMRVEWPAIGGGLLTETYPASLSPVHFALAEGPVLISYAATIRLEVRHLGASYRAGGLGNVLTYPGFRRRGYGERVVRAATRHLDGEEVDVAALFCSPALVPFYARCGWEPIVGAGTTTGANHLPLPADEVRKMRFISDHGRAGRQGFATQPLHLDHTW